MYKVLEVSPTAKRSPGIRTEPSIKSHGRVYYRLQVGYHNIFFYLKSIEYFLFYQMSDGKEHWFSLIYLTVYQPLMYYSYLPTPPLGQDMTQGQFLSGV